MTLYVYKYVNTSSVISTGFPNNTAGPIWLVSAWKNLAIDFTNSSALKSVYWNHICLCNSKCNFSHLIGLLKTFILLLRFVRSFCLIVFAWKSYTSLYRNLGMFQRDLNTDTNTPNISILSHDTIKKIFL